MNSGLLVSIHDVTPALAEPVKQLWKLCRDRGVTPALLVVPNWHGRWPLSAHPAFMQWVHTCAEDGAEILLHGERHDEVGLPRTLSDSWRAVGRTAREGEFLTLNLTAATERIERGVAQLLALKLRPIGFVPPAWLARHATHTATRNAGLAVSEDASKVYLHTEDASLRAPALRWSGRTPLRARLSEIVARTRWHTHRNEALLRLALHPQDLQHPVTQSSVERETTRWLAQRPVVRYADLTQ